MQNDAIDISTVSCTAMPLHIHVMSKDACY